MAEREQEQRLQESVANCDQINSEMKRLQRRKQAVASGKEKNRTATEPVVTRSRPESRMRWMKRADREAASTLTAWLKST